MKLMRNVGMRWSFITACVVNASAWLPGCLCPQGARLCDDQCIDMSSSPTNCGACGRVCAADEVCTNAECVLAPGVCRPTCPAGRRCSDGRCVCAAGTACGSDCVDLDRDPRHCGACGDGCPSGASCSSGACVCPSTAPSLCSGACVNLQNSHSDCGRCGNACPATATCVAGMCRCPGTMGLFCSGACVDASVSTRDCGACGNLCALECADGACLRVEEASIGGSHVAVRMSDATLWSWGQNTYCQLGTGECGPANYNPTRAYPRPSFTQVVAGQGHTCGISLGQVYCWGWDEDGQLGNGTTAFAYRGALLVPLDHVTHLEAGYATTCALRDDGSVWCWGNAADGLVSGSGGGGTITTPTRWGTFSDVVQVAAGREVCVRRSTGQVHCSGYGSTGGWPYEVTDWAGATDVDVGSEHACAILDGRVSCRGSNRVGQLGDGTTGAWGGPTSLYLGERAVDITLATSTSCARVESGRVYCWGSGSSGLTGPGGAWTTPSPLPIPSTVGSQWLACGQGTCCVHFGGTDLRCWGDNFNGQLGDRGTADRTTPFAVVW